MWLGSSAANALSFAFVSRWAGRVIGAAAFFLCPAKQGRRSHKQVTPLSLWQSRESDFIDICALHARAPLPSKPLQGKCVVASPVRPQLLSSAVFSCHFTGESLGPMRPSPSQRPVECACRSGSPAWGLEPVAPVLAHQDGATVVCVGPVVRVSLSHPFSAILAGLVSCGSG